MFLNETFFGIHFKRVAIKREKQQKIQQPTNTRFQKFYFFIFSFYFYKKKHTFYIQL